MKFDLEGPMKCYHCSNDMVYEKFYGPQEHFWGWRCIFCGEIVDPVILENRNFSRVRSAANTIVRKKGRPDNHQGAERD
jgi:hypothetical protein